MTGELAYSTLSVSITHAIPLDYPQFALKWSATENRQHSLQQFK